MLLKQAFVLSLLSFPVARATVDVIPRDGVYVFHEENMENAWEMTRIISDFPVSNLVQESLWIDDYFDNHPIDDGHLTLVVTGDCPQVPISVSESYDGEGRVLRISSSGGSGIDRTSFLEPSAFTTQWVHSPYPPRCAEWPEGDSWPYWRTRRLDENEKKQTWSSGRVSWNEDRDFVGYEEPGSNETSPMMRGGGAMAARPANREPLPPNAYAVTRPPNRPDPSVTRPPSRGPPTQPSTEGCKVNVDIYSHGCRPTPLNINAPIARTIPVGMGTESEGVEVCVTTATMTSSVAYQTIHNTGNADPNNSPAFELPKWGEECSLWQYGRPFVDQRGTPITASLLTDNHRETCLWSASSNGSSSAPSFSDDEEVSNQRRLFGEEWARKALGEHSSVASFAAFVIALMSNRAPPKLIQDSLTAAQDEVRHALVSFEVASLFLEKQPVEPSPLPPSSHQFGQDLTALALATATEGCIHETLSAIIMAVEADQQLDQMDWLASEEKHWLKEKMAAIAMDEARHSSLAWRTIRWVCDVDNQACEAVKSAVLEPSYLQNVAQKRLGKDHKKLLPLVDLIQATWSGLYNILVPLATKAGDVPGCGLVVATEPDQEPTSLAKSVSELLMQDFCGYTKKLARAS